MDHRTDTEAAVKAALLRDFDSGFSELVREYQPGIFRGAVRLTPTVHDAQDVAQEAFVRAYRALASFDVDRINGLRVRAWLWTIALNLCRNRAERVAPEARLQDVNDPSTTDPDTLDDALWNRRLDALTADQRAAVVMRHVLDMSVAEVSEATGRPEGTVKADVSRGLERLRATMEAEVLHVS